MLSCRENKETSQVFVRGIFQVEKKMDGELCKGKTDMEPWEELTECEGLGEKRAECMWKIIRIQEI